MSVYQTPSPSTIDRIPAWRRRAETAERLGADYARPLTALDEAATRAHLAALATGAAPSRPLGAPPAWRRILGALMPALLSLALLLPTASARPAGGMVMHINESTFEILGVAVIHTETANLAGILYDSVDADRIEDAFDVEIERELAIPAREQRRLGVDEMRAYAVDFDGAEGMIYAYRDGRTVFTAVYFAFLFADEDVVLDYIEATLEDGIDAATPRGFTEIEREEDATLARPDGHPATIGPDRYPTEDL